MGNLAWLVVAGVCGYVLFWWREQRRRKQALPLVQAGLAHHRSGNFDAAIADYDKALACSPKMVEVRLLRAEVLKARGDLDGAISDYSKYIWRNPKSENALLARGAAFEVKGLIAPAIADYSRAIKSSTTSLPYLIRAGLHLKTDNPAAAVKDYTAAINKNPDNVAAYHGRAAAYDRLAKPDLANADRDAAVRIAAKGRPA